MVIAMKGVKSDSRILLRAMLCLNHLFDSERMTTNTTNQATLLVEEISRNNLVLDQYYVESESVYKNFSL